jgi:hypothetical protein
MKDTSEEVIRLQREIILSKTTEERFILGLELSDFVIEFITGTIRAHNPGISDTDIKIELFERFYGKEFSDEEKEKIFRSLREYPERNDR